MDERLRKTIERTIEDALGRDFRIKKIQHTSGGCINETASLQSENESFFVKINVESRLPSFENERDGLIELASAKAIRTPTPLVCGTASGRSFLVLEALKFGSSSENSWRQFGKQLAQLHRTTGSMFGWHQDNVIGATPQPNTRSSSWVEFFRDYRLRPQLNLAHHNGYPFNDDRIFKCCEKLLEGHTAQASLLHGDLWSGNASFLEDGAPVIFDPATYYGDRETDLAFTEFFGGFSPAFYEAYQSEWTTPVGYQKRKSLYNLYHALNHLNLFGSGYQSTCDRLINSFESASH